METSSEENTKAVGRLSVTRLKQFGQDEDCPKPIGGITRHPSTKKGFQKYESLKIFKAPVQLISVDKTKKLRYNEDAIAELLKVDHNVNVISVVGLYRTGKSLLLNRLAGVDKAFDIGHTCNAKTLGLWIMCIPHPTQESQVLVLLDTEGLGAVLEDKLLEDRWHFLLATLLSSTMVYNHKGVLDSDAIQKLTFLKEIKTSMTVVDSGNGEDSYFDVFFPSFVMVIRDNSLKITDAKNNPISPDQYLENALTVKAGSTDSIRSYNIPRLLIRKYFKERKCFMFAPPAKPEALSDGRSVLNNKFEKDVDAFVQYIYACKPKRMTSGKAINGRMFGCLVRSYTRFIQEGKPPCMHTAVKEMIEYENQTIVEKAQKVYKKEMQNLITDSLPDRETMAKFHLQSTEKAIQYIREGIIYDDVDLFMDTAMDSFKQALERLIKSITKDSEKLCWGRLVYLDTVRIQKKIRLKTYEHISGYDEYMADVEWTIKQYKKTIGLGPKKRDVLQSYLDGKQEEEEMVYQLVKAKQAEQPAKESDSNIGYKERLDIRGLSLKAESAFIPDIVHVAKEDQDGKKRELTETFQRFKELKDKELDRQKQEHAEIASDTEKENKQFCEMFLDGSVASKSHSKDSMKEAEPIYIDFEAALGDSIESGTLYMEPWDKHGLAAPAGYVALPQRQIRPLPQKRHDSKKCKIL